jgi:hypothetical protein
LQSAREIVEFGVEPVVALAAIEEGRDRADVILVIARVEQEPFLPLQFGRATAAIDIAFAHDKHSGRWVRDARGLPQAEESFELRAAIRALHPVRRHDDDEKFGSLEPVVDNVRKLIALVDAAPVPPDIRLSRPEIAQLQAQLLIEETDEAGFVRIRRQDEVVIMSIGQEDDDVVAHRSSLISLERPRFPVHSIGLNP